MSNYYSLKQLCIFIAFSETFLCTWKDTDAHELSGQSGVNLGVDFHNDIQWLLHLDFQLPR